MSWPSFELDGGAIVLQDRGGVIVAEYAATAEGPGRTGVYVPPEPGRGVVCTDCDPPHEVPHTEDEQDALVRLAALKAHARYHLAPGRVGRPSRSLEEALAEVSQ